MQKMIPIPAPNVEPQGAWSGMDISPLASLKAELSRKSAESASYATDAVDLLLKTATSLGASDLHLLPLPEGLEVRCRVDGVLLPVAVLPVSVSAKVIARLKVLAELLTYRMDVPQEGRIRSGLGALEMRLSVLPTLHGEKAVIRLFAQSGRYEKLDDLGLPAEIARTLRHLLGATSGAILLSGPAGSGKTTTIYACLRELVEVSQGRRSLVSLEDPVEVALNGVSQTQINPNSGLTLDVGLRAILRQDPEVIAVGEIRDRPTAEVAFQASLTGHLVLSTFHSGSAAGVIGRLVEMEIEPYLLRSGLLAIVAQRLARRLCECSIPGSDLADALGLDVSRFRKPGGCETCAGTGYKGRIVLAEMLVPQANEVGRAILDKSDVSRLQQLAIAAGMIPLASRAVAAGEAGLTSPAENRRVLGISDLDSQEKSRAPIDAL